MAGDGLVGGIEQITLAGGKARQGRGRQLMSPQRHLGQGLALGLQHQHQLGHAQATATVHLGNRQGLQARLDAQRPERRHHWLAADIPLAHVVVMAVVDKQSVGHLGNGALVFAQFEIHWGLLCLYRPE